MHMPASIPIKALGALTAILILSLAFTQASHNKPDPYAATMKLFIGALMVAGSLFLSISISGAFLRNGGRNAFKALYWASLSSTGLGVSEAASGLIRVSVSTGLILTSLIFAASGVAVLHFISGAD